MRAPATVTNFTAATITAASTEGPAKSGTASVAVNPASAGKLIGQYDIYEITLPGKGRKYANPWDDVTITAVFTSPSGRERKVGGFYYDANTWKVRFAPDEVGLWTWKVTFVDPQRTLPQTVGSFTATPSANTGFMRVDQAHPRHFYTESDGKVFYPIGFNSCVGGAWPIDGTAVIDNRRGQRFGSSTKVVSQDDYFQTYSSQGKDNYFRAGPGNCAPELYQNFKLNVKRTGKNFYNVNHGKVWDQLVSKLHQYGYKYQMEMTANPGELVPNFDLSPPGVESSVLDYYRYIVNRYGAYVDIWELFNEQGHVPQAFLDTLSNLIKASDPYSHPITLSYDQLQDNESAFSVSAGIHRYYDVTNIQLDDGVAQACRNYAPLYPNKPVIAGEVGNGKPYGSEGDPETRGPERYRIMLWTFNMNQCPAVFWNMSGAIVINPAGASNMYIGPQERAQSTIFANFISGFDPAAQPVTVALSPANKIRAYVLAGSAEVRGYFVQIATHSSTLSGATVTLSIPNRATQGEWIDPVSGNVLETFSPAVGTQQTLKIPGFSGDIALRVH